jgi:hypothetical protein
MFPERSEGEAQAGPPSEETTVDASQPSEEAASVAPSADPVEETAAEATPSDADASSEDTTPEEGEEPTAEDGAVAEEAEAEEDAEESAPSGSADDDAEEPVDEAAAAAVETEEPVVEAVVAVDHSDDPHHWDGPSVPFVHHHALLEGMMALAFLTFGLIFISMIPAPLEARANPYLSPEGVLPEWYLMAPFELLHLVPPLPGMLGVGAAVGVLMLWPFIDRHPRRITRRPFLMALTFVILASILALSIIPYVHTGE